MISENEGVRRLREGIESWRSAGRATARLSETTRQRVLSEVLLAPDRRSVLAPLSGLFLPARSWALAVAAPAALLAAVLGYWAGGPAVVHKAETRLAVAREGGDVVLLIANGGRVHEVRKSATASAVGPTETFRVTDGKFRDRLEQGGPDMVFYRVN